MDPAAAQAGPVQLQKNEEINMAKNDDLILRGKALKDLRGIKDVLQSQGDPFLANIMNRAIECIENQPAADSVEVVHGYDTGKCRIFKCSECGYGVDDIFQEDEHNYPVGEFNYCPNCGARMDKEEQRG